MHNEIAAPDVQAIVSNIWYLVTLLGTVAATLYYIRANLRDIHPKQAPSQVDRDLNSNLKPIPKDHIRAQPWSRGVWQSEGPNPIRLRAQLVEEQILVAISGIGVGSHILELTLIDSTGNDYVGELRCCEHGGTVASRAVLKRLADNRLRLQLYPISDLMPNVDVFLSHVVGAKQARASESIRKLK
ncbi:MAG: hypothetical protein K9M08_14510 [Pirellula sp.]|nr:hypothetical protein [Pirellula sp.]